MWRNTILRYLTISVCFFPSNSLSCSSLLFNVELRPVHLEKNVTRENADRERDRDRDRERERCLSNIKTPSLFFSLLALGEHIENIFP